MLISGIAAQSLNFCFWPVYLKKVHIAYAFIIWLRNGELKIQSICQSFLLFRLKI